LNRFIYLKTVQKRFVLNFLLLYLYTKSWLNPTLIAFQLKSNLYSKLGKHGEYQTLLKQIKLSIVDRKTCQAKLRRTENISDSFVLENSLICAGGDANKV
jgi:hypothetical protein